MEQKKITVIPNFLKATTPDLLRESMLLNNLRMQSFVQYQDIKQLNDGSFICWYYEEIPQEKIIPRIKKPKG